jgi:hypothetical protein
MDPTPAPLLPPPPPPVATHVARAQRAQAIGSGAATTVGIGAALLAGRAVGAHLPPCPFLAITGVPCPFCGLTRLGDSLARLQVGEAVAASPGGVALLVGLGLVALTFLWTFARRRPPPSWLGSPVLAAAAALALVAHWGTSIVVGLPV